MIVYKNAHEFETHTTADTWIAALNDWRLEIDTPQPQALPPLFVVDVEADE